MNAPTSARPGRNEPCPCGSGRKYKQCCLAKDESLAAAARKVAAEVAAATAAPVEGVEGVEAAETSDRAALAQRHVTRLRAALDHPAQGRRQLVASRGRLPSAPAHACGSAVSWSR
jgi:hypothetical protein